MARTRAAQAEPEFVRHRAGLSSRVEEILHCARQLDLWQATRSTATASGSPGAARRSARATAAGRAVVVLGCGLRLAAMPALVPTGLAPFSRTDT